MHLTISSDLRVALAGPATFHVLGSGLASAEGTVDSGTLDLLSHFTEPALVEDVRVSISALLELDDATFDTLIESFRELGWLVDAEAPDVAQATGAIGFGSLRVQHAMVRDAVRVDAYRAALLEHARGRIVLDLGSGTGLLAMLAAKAGAKHVYAIEASAMADVAQRLFEANGVADKITLLRGVSTDLELPERADLLVHEVFDTDPLAEDILRYIRDAKARLLTDDALLLPEALEVCVTALQLPDRVDPAVLGSEARAAGARLGLDLTPLADALVTASVCRQRIVQQMPPGATPLSDESVVWRFALGEQELAAAPPTTLTLKARAHGIANSLVISFRAHFPGGAVLSTGVYAAATCWGWLVSDMSSVQAVKPGDPIEVAMHVEETVAGPRCRADLAPVKPPD